MPQGAEAAAVRRAAPSARVVEVPAGAASAHALPEFERGEMVIALGLCGALWHTQPGQVVIYGRVVDAASTFVIDPELVDALSAELPQAAVVNACTTRRVVTTVEARRVLAQRFNAEVVDMEGTHLAEAVAGAGARFGSVRVVSDDASRDLPPLENIFDDAGRLQPLAVGVAFLRKPVAAWRFARDVQHSLSILTDVARMVGGVA